MKHVFRNKYVKSFKFTSSQEAFTFLSNQETKNILSFEKTSGDNYYCYVCYHSLTSKKQFILSFNSDENEDDLNFVFWYESRIFVLDTGKSLYLIDNKLNIIASFDIITPLVGLYLTIRNTLLVLEESSLRLINSSGYILKYELFSLIEDFSIESNQLFVQTYEGSKVFDLI